MKLHRQFGHPPAKSLVDLLKKSDLSSKRKLLKMIEVVTNECSTCRKFKKPSPRPIVSMPLSSKFNECVAMDLKVWGNKYFLVMIDIATRYCAAVVICNKNPDTIIRNVFIHWISIFGAPKSFFSDNGGGVNNHAMRTLGEKFNITMKTTAAQSPWSNGVCERKNAVIGDSVRKIVDEEKCCVEIALAWTISARNSLANNHGFSPNQLVFGENPNLPSVYHDKAPAMNQNCPSDLVRQNLNAMHKARQEFIKCESSEKVKRALRHNIRACDSEEIDIGHSVFYKRDNDHEWHGPARVIGRDGKVILVRHGGILVRVHECRLASAPTDLQADGVEAADIVEPKEGDDTCCGTHTDLVSVDPPINQVDPSDGNISSDESVYESPIEPTDSKDDEDESCKSGTKGLSVKVGQRIRGVLKDGGNVCGKLVSRAGKASGKHRNAYNLMNDDDGTVTWMDLEKDFAKIEVVQDEVELVVLFNSDVVTEAKRSEIEMWDKNGVYEEVDNVGQDTISVRWVITEKIKEGKPVVKARLVARGFEEHDQDMRKDSPTCSREAVRLTLALSAAHGWDCHTIDVKAAYLQGDPIEREVFLRPPPEFDNGKLWKLHKTVYGLKDAARHWYLRVKEELKNLGMKISSLDPALFSLHLGKELIGVICLYVDDILWAGNESFHSDIIQKLSDLFLIGSSASKAFTYIGLRVKNEDDATFIDQFDYIKTLNPIKISKKRLNEKNSDLNETEKADYKAMIGQLNWIATHTRPDIAFEVCELSVLLKKATVSDLIRLNKLIGRTVDNQLSIFYPKLKDLASCTIECYSDASFGNLPCDGSQGGHIIFLKDSSGQTCPIYWESRKIRRVVKSTLAAETLALLDCAETAVYIRRIFQELCKCDDIPINCYIDNKSLFDALMSKKKVDDRRLRIDVAVLKNMQENHEIASITWVGTAHQLADCLTKRGASARHLRSVISRE